MDNILIEGDNYRALQILNYTHNEKIDVIYIDPPYNTGNKFIYNDKIVGDDDAFKHSKWLSFMSKRLLLAKKLLCKKGLIIIHIDEHEQAHLHILMNSIFNEKNFLGTIVWDKKNPKGDSRGISYKHEQIVIFAKNKEEFFKINELKTPKENALEILKKAEYLLSMHNKETYPDDLKKICQKYKIQLKCIHQYKQKMTLEQIRVDFKNWMKNTDFSGGEKAYDKIDDSGRVYRLVSMAWPNKKKAADEYFTPLIHPKTKKSCPVPQRGWRYSLDSMSKLLGKNLIAFGKDESTQPQRIYYLDENMTENIHSIIRYGKSDDPLLRDLNLVFENPKPVEHVKNILQGLTNKNSIILDFFAGSGTTGHAVMELNKEDKGNRRFMLCTNNESNICTDVCYPRLKKIINGYETHNGKKINGLGSKLHYFKINDKIKPNKVDKRKITNQIAEILCVKEICFDLKIKENNEYRIYKNEQNGNHFGIIYTYLGISKYLKAVKSIKCDTMPTYIFSHDCIVSSKLKNSKVIRTIPVPGPLLNLWNRGFRQ